jgi:hypothetical protein
MLSTTSTSKWMATRAHPAALSHASRG